MSDTINLSKGQRIDLSKAAPSLTKVRAGLGWSSNRFTTGGQYDLDVTAFLLKPMGDPTPQLVLPSARSMVFYGNLSNETGSVTHSGDNQVGGVDDTDEESIILDLNMLANEGITEVSFVVTIHEAVERRQNFGQVADSYIVLYDDVTGLPIPGARYQLEDEFSSETAVQFGSLYRNTLGNWAFKAVGQGFAVGLRDFVVGYGGEKYLGGQ